MYEMSKKKNFKRKMRMYEMSKMTLEQEEVRNQEYNEYVEQMTPKHNLWANMGKAFLLGGGFFFCWGEVSACWDRLFYRLQPGYSDLRQRMPLFGAVYFLFFFR